MKQQRQRALAAGAAAGATLGLFGLILAIVRAARRQVRASRLVHEMSPWRDVKVGDWPEEFKGRDRPRAVEQVDMVIVHVTDVAGGFGLTTRQIKNAGDAMQALADRYRKTPYHGVYSPTTSTRVAKTAEKRGALITQWPAVAETWHGHQNKDTVGWAYDGKFPGDEIDAEGAKEAFRRFIAAQREQGAQISYVETHAQHHDQRARDPGPEVFQQVITPLLDELGLELSSRTTRSGKLPDWAT